MNIFDNLPSKEGLTYSQAQNLVKEKKADGYKAFLESCGVTSSRKLIYKVIWYTSNSLEEV